MFEKYPEVLKYNQNNKLNLLSQIIITLESDHQFETFEGILKKNPEIINNLDYATNNTSKNTPIHLLMEKNSSKRKCDLYFRKIITIYY